LRGALDVPALERALRELCKRHEVLRTTLASVDGHPTPHIHENVDLELSSTRIDASDEAILAEVHAETQRPFDLAAGPLWRPRLRGLGAGDHVLVLGLHHVVFDAWSHGVLNRELRALYSAFYEGKPSPLPDLAIQYADYAAWQRRWLSNEILDRQIAYW